jgi:hypothetical protein
MPAPRPCRVGQGEDQAGGDLNFVRYYESPTAGTAGILRIHAEAARRTRLLPRGELHALVVAGLAGLCLSDPKVRQQRLVCGARRLVLAGGL